MPSAFFKPPATAAAFRERIEKEEFVCSANCCHLCQPAGASRAGVSFAAGRHLCDPAEKAASAKPAAAALLTEGFFCPRGFRKGTCRAGLSSLHSRRSAPRAALFPLRSIFYNPFCCTAPVFAGRFCAKSKAHALRAVPSGSETAEFSRSGVSAALCLLWGPPLPSGVILVYPKDMNKV